MGKMLICFYMSQLESWAIMQEAILTAKEIREKYTKDIYVWCDYSVQHMYSQVAMQAFKMAGIEFVAAIPVLSNDLSKRENDCTIAYCESRGIKYELFHIDVPELFDGPDFCIGENTSQQHNRK